MSENSEPNPYNSRDHEHSQPIQKQDLAAVASLFGHVAGSLSEIDRQNVGGANQFIKAKKIDPKAAMSSVAVKAGVGQPTATQTPVAPPPVTAAVPQIPSPVPVQPTVNQQPYVHETNDLLARVNKLEKLVETYKKVVKFKRGVSYNIVTNTVVGEYKDPEAILDLVASSLANQTKSITIKLNDKSKDRK